jgi:hypothetical protein
LDKFTEKTIQHEGWYWHVPAYPEASIYRGPAFVFVPEDALEEDRRALKCRRYAGEYFGPVNVDALKRGFPNMIAVASDYLAWVDTMDMPEEGETPEMRKARLTKHVNDALHQHRQLWQRDVEQTELPSPDQL